MSVRRGRASAGGKSTLVGAFIEVKKAFSCFRRVVGYCRAYKYRLLWVACLSPITSIGPLVTPWLMQLLIDRAYPTRDVPLLGWLCAALLAVGLLSRGLSVVSKYQAKYVESLLQYRLSLYVFNAIQKLPQSYREQHGSGVFLERAGSDVKAVSVSVTRLLPEMATIATTFLVAIPLMMRLSIAITLIALAVVPLNYLITVYLTGRVIPLSMATRSVTEKITTFTQETVEGATLSRLFSLKRVRRRQLRKLLRERLDLVFATWRVNAFWGQLATLASAAWGATLLCGGWYLVFTDRLQLGQAVALSMYIRILTRPFEQLGRLYQSFLDDSVAARRLLEMLDASQPMARRRSQMVLGTPPRHCEFRQLSFGYRGQRLCLQNIDLHLRASQTMAIVGPTGGGKSTLIRILCGLEDGYQGQFLVNGHDFRDIDHDSYLQHVSLVPQTTFFFSGPIRGNLPGNGSVSMARLHECASALGLNTLIDSIPDGFGTELGSEGIRLSGGQYQKLAALRAMLKNAPVLLLDEVTASMDIESERKLLQGIIALRPPDCLTLLVTHHIGITTEPWIDDIVVLMDGRIAERGSCAELLDKRGFYHRWLRLSEGISSCNTEFCRSASAAER